jgi:WhiB family redox-sensing transcriptional regulator
MHFPNAACAGVDPKLFFVEVGESTTPAKRLCQSCPAWEPCLEYAVQHPEERGVWGGTNDDERRAIRRRRRLAV